MRECPHIGFYAAMSVMLALLCVTESAAGQDIAVDVGRWSGEFSFNAGSNFERHSEEIVYWDYSPFFTNMNGGASAKLGYEKGRFYINGTVSSVSDDKITTRDGFTGNLIAGGQGADTVRSNAEHSDALTSSWQLNSSLNAGWTFNGHNRLYVNYKFDMSQNSPVKEVYSASFDIGTDIDTSKMRITGVKWSGDSTLNTRTNHFFAIRYLHDFGKPGRTLETAVNGSVGSIENYTFSGILTETAAKRDTVVHEHENEYYDESLSLLFRYTDKQFVNVRGLDADFSFKTDYTGDKDWLTKTDYTGLTDRRTSVERYYNYELKPTPGLHLVYSIRKFSVDLTCSSQFYFYKTYNETEQGHLTIGTTAELIDFKGSYNPWPGHSVNLVYKRDVKRPDYLQLCPIERIGNSSNEIIVGNPYLKPAAKNKFSILYNYGHGRLSSALEAGLTYERGKIGQLISVRRDSLNMETRVRSWYNAEDGYTINTKLSLFWKGSLINAGLSANWNYFYGLKDNGSYVETSDWSCRGSISYLLKTWVFNAALSYQSKIIRQYTSITEIIGLDLKVEKKFGRFGIFMEGRNLLDRDVITITESDDGMSARAEEVDNNNRLVLIGLKYGF